MFTLPNDYTAVASISRQHQGVKSTLETPLHSPEPVRNLSFGYEGPRNRLSEWRLPYGMNNFRSTPSNHSFIQLFGCEFKTTRHRDNQFHRERICSQLCRIFQESTRSKPYQLPPYNKGPIHSQCSTWAACYRCGTCLSTPFGCNTLLLLDHK